MKLRFLLISLWMSCVKNYLVKRMVLLPISRSRDAFFMVCRAGSERKRQEGEESEWSFQLKPH